MWKNQRKKKLKKKWNNQRFQMIRITEKITKNKKQNLTEKIKNKTEIIK